MNHKKSTLCRSLGPAIGGKSSTVLDCLASLAFALAVAILGGQPAQAQTLNVIYSFTGGAAGGYPIGISLDPAGNIYGATALGGYSGDGCNGGCGVVFQLTPIGSYWVFNPLFTPGGDERLNSRPIIGPDGSLYGTGGYIYGYLYNLKPPATACKTVLCSWMETTIHVFDSGDGAVPNSEVAFDREGNFWGTTEYGGGCGEFDGALYEVIPTGGGWQFTIPHSFHCQYNDGQNPVSEVIFDSQGNVYGATTKGGDPICQCGTVYEYSPASGTYKVLYRLLTTNLTNRPKPGLGSNPSGGLALDQAGNLYGTTPTGGPGGGGTIFELTPVGDTWTFTLLHSFVGNGGGPGSLTMDAAGNIYGTTSSLGAYGKGSVFKLTPSNGGWTFTTIYDFGAGGPSDGSGPGKVIPDNQGNLWGTAAGGGAYGNGIVWEITP
jgi:uncharacterized repeat protein (TIGR03803 family)